MHWELPVEKLVSEDTFQRGSESYSRRIVYAAAPVANASHNHTPPPPTLASEPATIAFYTFLEIVRSQSPKLKRGREKEKEREEREKKRGTAKKSIEKTSRPYKHV